MENDPDIVQVDPAEALLPLSSVDAVATLDHLQASGAVAQGKVNIISLSAIAEQLGGRWSLRRDLVYDHADRTLQRQVGAQGSFQRISDTDYVICQPVASRLAGQAACLNSLRGILHHFLGAAVVADIRVHTVTRISADGVHGARLDVDAIDAAPPDDDIAPAAPGGSADRWSPFVASNGQRVRVSCVLEPIILLKASSKIGYRVVRRVLEMPTDRPLTAAEQRNLSRADILKVDLATISRGLDRLRSEGSEKDCPSLILPVSYITLSHVDGRAAVVTLFREAQAVVRHGVICEICDIEGVPASALSTVAAFIRPFCIYVVGRISGNAKAFRQSLKDVRLQGLTVEYPRVLSDDVEFIGWANNAVTALRPVARSLILCGLPSSRQMAVAAALGVSHASLRP